MAKTILMRDKGNMRLVVAHVAAWQVFPARAGTRPSIVVYTHGGGSGWGMAYDDQAEADLDCQRLRAALEGWGGGEDEAGGEMPDAEPTNATPEMLERQRQALTQALNEMPSLIQSGFPGEPRKGASDMARLLRKALTTDGAHHKQWYLQQLARAVNIVVEDSDPGVAP